MYEVVLKGYRCGPVNVEGIAALALNAALNFREVGVVVVFAKSFLKEKMFI